MTAVQIKGSSKMFKRKFNALLRKFVRYQFIKIDEFSDLQLYEDNKICHENKYLNIGAGNFYHPFWTNLDFDTSHYSQKNHRGKFPKYFIEHDLNSLTSLPVGSETVDVIYISHVCEHLPNGTVQFLFSECNRVLKEDGVFRITGPDIDLICDAYLTNDRHFFEVGYGESSKQHSLEQLFLDQIVSSKSKVRRATEFIHDDILKQMFVEFSREEAFDKLIAFADKETYSENPHFHMNWFNQKKMKQFLLRAGFKTVYPSGYMQSKCAILRNSVLFDLKRPQWSMYVEAKK